jgi:hypothetical protein
MASYAGVQSGTSSAAVVVVEAVVLAVTIDGCGQATHSDGRCVRIRRSKMDEEGLQMDCRRAE